MVTLATLWRDRLFEIYLLSRPSRSRISELMQFDHLQ